MRSLVPLAQAWAPGSQEQIQQTGKNLRQSKLKSQSSKSRNNPCVWLTRLLVSQDLPEAAAGWPGPRRGYTAEGAAWEVSASLTGSL